MPLFEKSKPVVNFALLSKLIYGFPKIGKTSFASHMSDDEKQPLFILTEDGTGMLEIYNKRVTSWDGFKRLVALLEKNEKQLKKEHSCIIIDLVSDLDAWCARYVANEVLHVQHIADAEYGKGFAMHREHFQEQITKLLAILPITFIAHSQEKEIQWHGEKIKPQSPSLSKGALEFINGKVDAIMWFVPENSKTEFPAISMKPSTRSVAGSRFPQITKEYRFNYMNPAATYAEIQKDFTSIIIKE